MSLMTLLGWTAPDRPRRLPVILNTERLELRPPRFEDRDAWAELRRDSRGFLQPWEPRWPEDHLTPGAFRRRVKWAISEAASDRAYSFLIFRREDRVLIGGLTVSNIRRGPSRSASLGYWIGAPYARQGYMRDAVGAAVEFAFDTLGLVRLEAASLEDNEASRALLARCGFQPEGTVRGYLEVDGAVRDHILYALLATDPVQGR